MMQLGVPKRTVETFLETIMRSYKDDDDDDRNFSSAEKTTDDYGFICTRYGGSITHRLDRKFPRCKFVSSVLAATQKNGSDYSGMLLCILFGLISRRGWKILTARGMWIFTVNKWIYAVEFILMMEEFLKHSTPTVNQLKMLKKTIIHFINTINNTYNRFSGQGTNLLKNHLFFHLELFIEYYGPPKGFDSGPSESHPKMSIKAPSKTT